MINRYFENLVEFWCTEPEKDSLAGSEHLKGKNLRFFGDCAPKKWPFGQLRVEAEQL
jgi:hypothetical protein